MSTYHLIAAADVSFVGFFFGIVMSILGFVLAVTWIIFPFLLLATLRRHEKLLQEVNQSLRAIEMNTMGKATPLP